MTTSLPLAGPHPPGETVDHVRPAGADLDDPVLQRRFTQASGDLAQSRLQVTGMHCAACAGLVEGLLRRHRGVVEARVNAGTQRLSLRWDAQQAVLSDIAAVLEPAGYGLRPDVAADAREQRQAQFRAMLWRLFVAGFCMMQVMMLAVPIYMAEPGEMPADQRQLLNWGAWMFSVPVLVFACGPFFRHAWGQIRQRRIGMDVPVALALAVTFLASTVAAFDPQGPLGSEVYFDSFTMFVFFLLSARTLEERLRHRSVAALENSVERLPRGVQRVDEAGATTLVEPEALRPGDVVRVPRGEAFPADGCVLEGRTQADESLLTGESEPQPKLAGDAVVAGSLNVTAPVMMRVLRVGPDTRYEAIVALMREALTQRPQWLQAADRWAAPFLWTVLLLAAAGAAVWSVVDPSRALWVAVSVLVVSCPCALSLAAPSSLLAAAGALSRRGVLVQRLDALEALAKMTRLFVDKTGTLTSDQLTLRRICGADGHELHGAAAQQVLAAAAALAQWSAHPLSRALVRASVRASGAAIPEREGRAAHTLQDVHEEAGQGLRAVRYGAADVAETDPRAVRLGRVQWVSAMPGVDLSEAASASRAQTWFAVQGEPAWCFEFEEEVRADAAAAMQALHSDGVRVSVLSGDEPGRVLSVARRLALDSARGGMSPHDKLAALEVAQAQGDVVGMLGDGINDAPVLARANVSLAMGQGALVARQQADAVVVSERLADVVTARRLARRTLGVVRQNLAWAAGYNLTCIPLALAGLLPPWLAGLGMALSSLLVVLNAQRLSRV